MFARAGTNKKEFSIRKPTLLKNYDYSQNGYYFVTICSHNKQCIFGSIVGGGALDAPQSKLSDIGKIVEKYILSTNNILGISVDKYVIMPNHIHLILSVQNSCGTSKVPSPTNNIISRTISTLKRFVNKEVEKMFFSVHFTTTLFETNRTILKYGITLTQTHTNGKKIVSMLNKKSLAEWRGFLLYMWHYFFLGYGVFTSVISRI